jgi:hypothetical protein
MGVVSQIFHHEVGGFEWGLPTEQGPFTMDGPTRTDGDIDIFLQNYRVGGPRILQYKVTLKSITIERGYEEADCEEPNEIFVHARAFLSDGSRNSKLIPTTRLDNGVWSLRTGERRDFGAEGILQQKTYSAETAPESPLLYVEIGVWEDDDEKDLLGIHSETTFLADFLGYSDAGVDEVTPEGLFVRRVKDVRSRYVNGFAGSDNHCWDWWDSYIWFPHAPEGKVRITYEVEVTWLKRMRR